jgi:hypothetical protein
LVFFGLGGSIFGFGVLLIWMVDKMGGFGLLGMGF